MSEIFPAPGSLRGPFKLPVSYTHLQLVEYGWDGVKFCKAPSGGGWGSRLNNNRWKESGPRSRAWSSVVESTL